MRRRFHILSISIAAATLTALFASASIAAPAKAITTNISPQPLVKALDAFAAQTGLQLVYRPEIAAGLKSRGARAGQSVESTLLELLRETGLVFEFVNERTVTIQLSGEAQGSGASKQTALPGGRADSIALARAFASQSAPRAGEDTETKDAAAQTAQKGVPEILVRGRRTSNTGIERTEDDVQPYVVFDADEIQRSMTGTLGDFLKTRLPMNAVSTTPSQNPAGPFGSQSQINLRGLGPDQTLVLVNGRRMPSVSSISVSETVVQPDINGIPMEIVERIEVLPSTASGIYGGGATGGVVNIVLKREYSGLEIQGNYDNTFDSDAAQRRFSASAGVTLEGGRTHLLMAGSYADANPFLVRERDFARRGRALNFANNRAFLLNGAFLSFGATPNIRSGNGQNLALKNGTPGGLSLGSRITHVPVGYAGASSDGGAALVRNAGMYNFDLPDDVRGTRQSLLSNPTVESLSLSARREFSSAVEAFVDVSMFNNKGRAHTGFGSFTQNLAANAPNNPFVGAITVNYPSPNVEFETLSDSNTLQAAGGLIARLPGEWTAQADYSWSRSRASYSSTSPVISNAGEAAIANGTLNILRDLNAYPLNLDPYLLPSPNNISGPADSILHDVSLRLAGPTFGLPGGPLMLSALLELRREMAEDTFYDQIDFFTDEPTIQYFPHRGQKVRSAYLEATAPVLSSVQLQVSARRDEYETETVPFGGALVASRDAPLPTDIERVTNEVQSTDYTVGIRYSPFKSVALRVSYGTGFLPPSISQLFPLEFPEDFAFITDPKRSGVQEPLFPIAAVYGGNPDLLPERSQSWSAGAIFTPGFLPGLRLSVDYTRIRKSDEISDLPAQEAVTNEEAFPGRVTRAPLTQDDIDAGYTGGAILRIDQTYINIAHSQIEAYDIQADYSWQTALGAFNAYMLATYQPEFRRQILPGSPNYNVVGYTGSVFSGGVLEWRGNGGLTLDRGPWVFGWGVQFYDSYLAYGVTDTNSQIAGTIRAQGSPTIPSQMYHDMSLKYRFDGTSGFARGWLADSEIMVGMSNVFDKQPPVIAITGPTGGYSPYADPRLRRYSLSLRKSF